MSTGASPAAWRRVATVGLGLAVGAAGLALSLRGVRWPALVEALKGVERGWLALAVVCSAGVGVLKATRWYRLFVPDHGQVDWGSVVATLLLAQMVNVVVPVRGGGEALRIALLTRRFPVSVLRVGGTIVLEKLLDVASLSLLAVAVAPIAARIVDRPILSRAMLLLSAGAFLGLALGVRFRRELQGWLERWPGIARQLDQLLRGFNALRSGDWAWEPVAWTAAVRCLSFASLLAAVRSMGVRVPLLAAVALDVLLNLSFLLPTPPALIGLVQYASVLVLGLFGIPRAEALGAGVMLHLTILSPFLLFGLPAWVYVSGFSPRPGGMGRTAEEGRPES